MNFNDAVREVEKAQTAADLFDFNDKSLSIRKYRELAGVLHPDKNPGRTDEATDAFARLSELWAKYQTGGSDTDSSIIISSRRRTFLVDSEPSYRGDLASLFRGRYNTDSEEHTVLLKMPRDPRNSDLMQNEGFKLRQIATEGDERFKAYVPQHVESFRHRHKDNGQERLTNVLQFPEGLYSLEEIRRAYPGGVDPKDAAWMWRRIFVACGHIHGAGVIHGAILPEHVLIHPEQHGLVLCDFCYAVEPGDVIKVRSARHPSDEYPEEVREGNPAGPETDIYMATKCMLYVLGDNAPRQMRAFANGCSPVRQQSRPTDTLALREEFDELLHEMYGKRKFHPFTMPERIP